MHLTLLATAVALTCSANPARTGYAMTWDGTRQRVVIFGGESTEGRLTSDLLAWDGKTWNCISTEGPPPRSDAMLAWDAPRQVLVLYGGRSPRGELRDTWELAGDGWQLRDENGPTPEPHGVMAYDESAGGLVLFGGLGDDSAMRRTWRWDGHVWSRLADGPNSQFPNAMFTVVTRSARLMTAKSVGPDQFNPILYRWTPAGWNEIATSGDTPVFSPQAPAAEMPNGAVLYAGFESNQTVSTWFLEASTWKKFSGPSPTRRKGAHMQYDPLRRVAVLHGGDNNGILDDTWEWDGRSWRRVPRT
jgi:hypothetical protein